jgi:hypothetical protein
MTKHEMWTQILRGAHQRQRQEEAGSPAYETCRKAVAHCHQRLLHLDVNAGPPNALLREDNRPAHGADACPSCGSAGTGEPCAPYCGAAPGQMS